MLDSNNAETLISEESTVVLADEPRHVNSVDATMGQPILDRVMTRKAELEAALAALAADDLRARGDIDLALTTINDLLTGDHAHLPPVVVAGMSRWLELNKHLAERAAVEAAPAADSDNADSGAVDDEVIDPVTSPVVAKEPAMVMPGG